MQRIAAIGAVLLCLIAAPVDGANPRKGNLERPGLLHDWRQRLGQAHEQLVQSNWQRGLTIADSVLRELKSRIVSGDGSAPLLAAALLFRAVAEAGLGDSESAAWDFGVAQSLHPEYTEADLSLYGEAGRRLAAWRYTRDSPAFVEKASLREAGASPEVTPPRRIDGGEPKYPDAKMKACVQDGIVVDSIIDERGVPTLPGIAPDNDPVLALATFDALRSWRFEPARRDGKPVRVYYALSVNFRTPYCH